MSAPNSKTKRSSAHDDAILISKGTILLSTQKDAETRKKSRGQHGPKMATYSSSKCLCVRLSIGKQKKQYLSPGKVKPIVPLK